MKKEINFDLRLEPGQDALIAMHGFYNMVRIIVRELEQIKLAFGVNDVFDRQIAFFSGLLSDFADSARALSAVRDCCEHKLSLLEELRGVGADLDDTSGPGLMLALGAANIESVLDFFTLRSREIHARLMAPVPWHPYDIDYVEGLLRGFLDLTVRVGRSRFGVVYSDDGRGERDYLVDIDIHGEDGVSVLMPRAINDCLRDLVANARKYTEPGGEIKLSIFERDSMLDICVADTGRGIPEEELEEVVRFGVRASGALDRDTCGGGFGLTRVYDTCRRFSGRMWIDSELERGTYVRLVIPVPVAGKM